MERSKLIKILIENTSKNYIPDLLRKTKIKKEKNISMKFLKKYKDNVKLIIERKRIIVLDGVFLSNNTEEQLITLINEQNDFIFGKNITTDNVTPIMVTENEGLRGWTDSCILFESENIFFILDIVSMSRKTISLYPDVQKLRIVEYEYFIFQFIPEFKFLKGSYPFEIIYPDTCTRPLIYIPLTAEEIAHYDYDLPF